MTDRKRLHLTATTAAGALALGLASPVQAQTEAQTPPPVIEPQPGAQEPAPAPQSDEDIYGEEGGEIVVTGVRRGSVVGDIPPENILSGRDVRATGANDITELLDALAPQIGSARGRGGERPILLLNGQRISGFRELRDIPTEAISRVEILPEEVALKYGYRADQRVVNIVLRQRFRSTVARVEGTTATEGGYVGGEADATQLLINRDGRTTANLRAEANSTLTESERNIALRDDATADDRTARTLIGPKQMVRATTTLNRTVFGDVSGTLNTEAEYNHGRSLFGLSDAALNTLVRETDSLSGHLGFSLNGDKGKWHWSSTGNGDVARSVTRSDQRDDETPRDRSETFAASADVDLTANGPLFKLPAGDANATFRVGASTLYLDAERRRDGKVTPNDLSRTLGLASANIDLPISRRNRDFSTLGNLTLNANAEVEQLSDFGTLLTLGAGLNWSPVDRLNFLTSWTREEGAPSMSQLGDPLLETPGTRIFDFRRGETVEVTSITGGNPDLLSDKRNVLKLGANWKPWEETDFRLRADFVHSRVERPIASFPGVTAPLEEAFPERFVREPCPQPCTGQLISVDFRPVNFDHATRDTLRWGFDFSRPLASARPSQAQIERFRQMRRAQGGNASTEGPPPPEGGPPPGGPEGGPPPGGGFGPGGGGFGPGGWGSFGGFGRGGRQGGRLTFSLTHTINLVDKVTIRPGVPQLDYLHGDAVGSTGGRSRHELEAQAGYFNNGLGARLSGNWRSGTRVNSETGDDLRFSSLTTFDLRLFANLGERFDLVAEHPWLRGSSVRLEVNNIFNSRPRVRDASGGIPNSYQADLLDPLGRTISISIRKLFLPPPSFFRRQQGQTPRS